MYMTAPFPKSAYMEVGSKKANPEELAQVLDFIGGPPESRTRHQRIMSRFQAP